MSYYEIVCIIHPALQAGHLEDTIKQINDKITSSKNGKVIYQENWGKKKLSYLIQKQKYGTYYIFQCELDGQFINELSDEFQHNTNIIRYLVSKIDGVQLMKEKKNIDEINNDQKVQDAKSNNSDDVEKDSSDSSKKQPKIETDNNDENQTDSVTDDNENPTDSDADDNENQPDSEADNSENQSDAEIDNNDENSAEDK